MDVITEPRLEEPWDSSPNGDPMEASPAPQPNPWDYQSPSASQGRRCGQCPQPGPAPRAHPAVSDRASGWAPWSGLYGEISGLHRRGLMKPPRADRCAEPARARGEPEPAPLSLLPGEADLGPGIVARGAAAGWEGPGGEKGVVQSRAGPAPAAQPGAQVPGSCGLSLPSPSPRGFRAPRGDAGRLELSVGVCEARPLTARDRPGPEPPTPWEGLGNGLGCSWMLGHRESFPVNCGR